MARTLLCQGAEAVLFIEGDVVVKERVPKRYRHPEIDRELRAFRTRREAKLLQSLTGIAPAFYGVDEHAMALSMEYVRGTLLRDILSSPLSGHSMPLLTEVGRLVGVLHSRDIIHGDLTTSNITERAGKVLLLDFGLGFFSHKLEDKAVDVHVFRQVLESKHHAHAEHCFRLFLEGYRSWKGSSEVLARLDVVGQRGRYKQKLPPIA